VQLELGQPEQAFATAERARALQLVDTVRRGKTQSFLSMTVEEQREEKRLGEALARLDGRVSQMPTLIQLITVVVAIWGMAFATLRFGMH